MKLLPSRRLLCTPYNHAPCHFISLCKTTYCKVRAYLVVTCYQHFWQNDRGLLRTTAVTRGWNGYRNKSQDKRLTLEKKKSPAFPACSVQRTRPSMKASDGGVLVGHCGSWRHSRRLLGKKKCLTAGWSALSWKNRSGPRVLGSLCCRFCCLLMHTSPLLILCSMSCLLTFLLSSSLSQARSRSMLSTQPGDLSPYFWNVLVVLTPYYRHNHDYTAVFSPDYTP